MRHKRTHYKESGEYIVYPDGRVFSKRRGIFLVPVLGKNKSQYLTVKAPKMIKVHRLVASLFIPNPNNYPQVNHIDGNKLNNNDWNLEWCTQLHNMQHSHRLGLHNVKGENSPTAKLDITSVRIIRECIAKGFRHKPIAKYFGVDQTTISNIKTGLTWK